MSESKLVTSATSCLAYCTKERLGPYCSSFEFWLSLGYPKMFVSDFLKIYTVIVRFPLSSSRLYENLDIAIVNYFQVNFQLYVTMSRACFLDVYRQQVTSLNAWISLWTCLSPGLNWNAQVLLDFILSNWSITNSKIETGITEVVHRLSNVLVSLNRY